MEADFLPAEVKKGDRPCRSSGNPCTCLAGSCRRSANPFICSADPCMGSPLRLSLWRDRVEAERRRTGEDKETRNAGEKPVHGFMGSILNPKAVALVLVY
jgi:hypothetical protein